MGLYSWGDGIQLMKSPISYSSITRSSKISVTTSMSISSQWRRAILDWVSLAVNGVLFSLFKPWSLGEDNIFSIYGVQSVSQTAYTWSLNLVFGYPLRIESSNATSSFAFIYIGHQFIQILCACYCETLAAWFIANLGQVRTYITSPALSWNRIAMNLQILMYGIRMEERLGTYLKICRAQICPDISLLVVTIPFHASLSVLRDAPGQKHTRDHL